MVTLTTGCGDCTWMILVNSVTVLAYLCVLMPSWGLMTPFHHPLPYCMGSAHEWLRNHSTGQKGDFIYSNSVKTVFTDHYRHAMHTNVIVVAVPSMHSGPIFMEICFFSSDFNHRENVTVIKESRHPKPWRTKKIPCLLLWTHTKMNTSKTIQGHCSCHDKIMSLQGSTLTFQLTSLVASDNLNITSPQKILLAKRCGWLPYYMTFLRFCGARISLHLNSAILQKICILNHFNFSFLSNPKFILLAMLLKHVFLISLTDFIKVQ